ASTERSEHESRCVSRGRHLAPRLLPEVGMRRGTILACLAWIALGACGKGGDSGINPDSSPIKLKVPPVAKDGTSTVASCDGVTARGECRQGVATYCDLERETLRKIDCKAQNLDCL